MHFTIFSESSLRKLRLTLADDRLVIKEKKYNPRYILHELERFFHVYDPFPKTCSRMRSKLSHTDTRMFVYK